jgi:hypothetical protein
VGKDIIKGKGFRGRASKIKQNKNNPSFHDLEY